MKFLNRAIAVIDEILRSIERKHLPVVAAGVAYYFLMSLFPALVLLTAVMAYLPLENGTQVAISFLAYVIPPQGLSVLQQLLTIITPHRTGLLSFGIIATLWLASKAMKAVISGLDIVYDVPVPRRVWVNRVLAFGLTFVVGVLLLLGVALSLAGPTLEGLLSVSLPAQSLWLRAWPYIQWLLSAIFVLAAIELLYLLAPNVPAAHRMTIPGALLATLTLLILSWGLGLYFNHFGGLKLDKLYGILATPIAFMIWLYWGAMIILIGAEINVYFQTYMKLTVRPRTALQNRTDAA